MPSHLYGKRARFVDHFVSGGFSNAALAAKLAGYSAASLSQSVDMLMKDQEVCDEIERRAEAAAKVGPSLEQIIGELSKIAFASVGDFVRIDDYGDPRLDFSEVTSDSIAGLAGIEVHTYYEGRGDDAQEVKAVKIKHTSKIKALEAIAKLQGHMVDKRITVNKSMSTSAAAPMFEATDLDTARRTYEEFLAAKG